MLLSLFAVRAGIVTSGQTFVQCRQNMRCGYLAAKRGPTGYGGLGIASLDRATTTTDADQPRVARSRSRTTLEARPAVEAACQLVALNLRERNHACLVSRISMASTDGSLRQRMVLRSASARLSAHSAWLQAEMPLGPSLVGGGPGKGIKRQGE